MIQISMKWKKKELLALIEELVENSMMYEVIEE